MKYYGFLQSHYGADHLYVYNEEQIREEFERCGISMDVLPTDKNNSGEVSFFPISGSNSGTAIITFLENDEAALEYLQQAAMGPDVEDPMLADIAEYYFHINTDEGCAKELLERAGLDAEKLSEEAYKKYADEVTMIVRELEIEYKDLYDDVYSQLRESDVLHIIELKKLINTTPLKFEEYDGYKVCRMNLPEGLAKTYLQNSLYGMWTNEDVEGAANNVFITIELHEDEEPPFSFEFVEYNGGNDLEFSYDDNERFSELLSDVIGKKVSDYLDRQRPNEEMER